MTLLPLRFGLMSPPFAPPFAGGIGAKASQVVVAIAQKMSKWASSRFCLSDVRVRGWPASENAAVISIPSDSASCSVA
jgi:hypothetical protein